MTVRLHGLSLVISELRLELTLCLVDLVPRSLGRSRRLRRCCVADGLVRDCVSLFVSLFLLMFASFMVSLSVSFGLIFRIPNAGQGRSAEARLERERWWVLRWRRVG